jgi:hypothetical protein
LYGEWGVITRNFLKSDFIMEDEVPAILRRKQSEGLAVYPVLARYCAFRLHKWLTEMQIRPRDWKPVWRRGGDSEKELMQIAEEVFEILKEVLPGRAVSEETPPSQKGVLEEIPRELAVAAEKTQMQ